MPTELAWMPGDSGFLIRASLLSLVVRFTPHSLRVEAELSLAAKLMATRNHRQNAVRFIDSFVNDLGL